LDHEREARAPAARHLCGDLLHRSSDLVNRRPRSNAVEGTAPIKAFICGARTHKKSVRARLKGAQRALQLPPDCRVAIQRAVAAGRNRDEGWRPIRGQLGEPGRLHAERADVS